MSDFIKKIIVTAFVLYYIVGGFVVLDYDQTKDGSGLRPRSTFAWDLITWPKFLFTKNNNFQNVYSKAKDEFINHAATGEEMEVNGVPVQIKQLNSPFANEIMMCSNFISTLSNKEELSKQDEFLIVEYKTRINKFETDQFQTVKKYCSLLIQFGRWMRNDILKALTSNAPSLTLGTEANNILETLEKSQFFSKNELKNMRQSPINIFSMIKNNGAQVNNLMKLYEELDRDSNEYYDKIFSE